MYDERKDGQTLIFVDSRGRIYKKNYIFFSFDGRTLLPRFKALHPSQTFQILLKKESFINAERKKKQRDKTNEVKSKKYEKEHEIEKSITSWTGSMVVS